MSDEQADLYRDEFLRILALNPSDEIKGLCERAISNIQQHTPVIKQRDDAEANVRKLELERDRLAGELRGTLLEKKMIEEDRDAARAKLRRAIQTIDELNQAAIDGEDMPI